MEIIILSIVLLILIIIVVCINNKCKHNWMYLKDTKEHYIRYNGSEFTNTYRVYECSECKKIKRHQIS